MNNNAIDPQDEHGTYEQGPLKGQTTVSVLIGEEGTKWLKHAVNEVGYSFAELVRIAVEEAALNHAIDNKLI